MTRTVLITGGAGFVGSNLSLRLKEAFPSWRVIAMDNLRRRGSELNLSRLAAGGVELLHGDVRSIDDFPAYSVNTVIDAAADPSTQAGYHDRSPRYAIDSNLVGLVNCLEIARRDSADVVFLSTSRVYSAEALNALELVEQETRFALAADQAAPGASACGISEEFTTRGQRSIYGTTKLCGELLVEEYSSAYGLRAITNRCGVIGGPWQMGKGDQGIFAFWAASHIYDRPLSYIGWGGGGKQVRDLVHIDDLCDLICLQVAKPAEFNGTITNVGGGLDSSLSLCEASLLCADITGKRLKIAAEPANRPADVCVYVSDTRKLQSLCGWRPRRTPLKTLEDTCAWISANSRDLQPILCV